MFFPTVALVIFAIGVSADDDGMEKAIEEMTEKAMSAMKKCGMKPDEMKEKVAAGEVNMEDVYGMVNMSEINCVLVLLEIVKDNEVKFGKIAEVIGKFLDESQVNMAMGTIRGMTEQNLETNKDEEFKAAKSMLETVLGIAQMMNMMGKTDK